MSDPSQGPGAVTTATLAAVAARFGIAFCQVRCDLALAGSPQRSLFRVAIEDATGDVFVVERIAPHQAVRRATIARWLDALHDRGLDRLVPYLADTQGNHVVRVCSGHWQVAPHVSGVPLPRPDWVHESWRGEALARFWLDLQGTSTDLDLDDQPAFSILDFARHLVGTIATRAPALVEDLAPVMRFLGHKLAPVHERLPVAFSHGDLHPLNVIWGTGDIRAVIDWEFCGPKPAIYDLANLIGCVGIEEPQALGEELVHAAITQLMEEDVLVESSWVHLPPFVVAVRLAWLSEWLRQRDREMIGLERDYLRLLIDHQEALYDSWCIPRP